jgi:cellulose synthase/poly-beta-1,6-N-acetylglucosamine synthase-like glycosyltransferase
MRVALCAATYRRPEGLQNLLDAIVCLEAPQAANVEVIIVDNTAEAVAASQVAAARPRLTWPLHYVVEKQRGITFARNAALRKAADLSCDFVAFIDDDEMPAPRWLVALLAARRRSGAAVILGAVEPVLPPDAPRWLATGRFFATPVFADGAELRDGYTGNVLIDLHRLSALGLSFDHRFALTGGEDTMLFRDLLDAGGRIVYAADAVVYETVPRSRARLTWLLKRWYRTGNVEAELFLRRRRRVPWRRPVNILRGLTRVALGSALFAATLLVLGFGRKDRIVRPLYTLCRGCGILSTTLGRRYAEYHEVHGA